jgi:hypothetical protein
MSNNAILNNPIQEAMRIVEELTTTCGVEPRPPSHITPEICKEFLVNPELQQQKMKGQEEEHKVIADYNGCRVYDFDVYRKVCQARHNQEVDMYEKVISENLLLQS